MLYDEATDLQRARKLLDHLKNRSDKLYGFFGSLDELTEILKQQGFSEVSGESVTALYGVEIRQCLEGRFCLIGSPSQIDEFLRPPSPKTLETLKEVTDALVNKQTERFQSILRAYSRPVWPDGWPSGPFLGVSIFDRPEEDSGASSRADEPDESA